MSPNQERGQVLLIEDHRDIAEIVHAFLESRGYTVDHAGDGLTGLHLAVTGDFDVIVLDLMLPGMDGIELCQKLRNEARNDTPVLMLTARDTLADKLTGLDAGADDYLVKPFAIQELEARIRALARRHRGEIAAEVLKVADLTLDLSTLKVQRGEQPLTLTPIGLKLLAALPDSDTLRSHLYNLRKVIDKPFPEPLLHTLHGSGYRIVAPNGH